MKQTGALVILMTLILFTASCNREERDFENAMNSGSISDLEGFLDKYDESAYRDSALYQITFLKALDTVVRDTTVEMTREGVLELWDRYSPTSALSGLTPKEQQVIIALKVNMIRLSGEAEFALKDIMPLTPPEYPDLLDACRTLGTPLNVRTSRVDVTDGGVDDDNPEAYLLYDSSTGTELILSLGRRDLKTREWLHDHRVNIPCGITIESVGDELKLKAVLPWDRTVLLTTNGRMRTAIPWGDGTVVRFSGRSPKIVNGLELEGTFDEPLCLALIDGLGLCYVGGKGRIFYHGETTAFE
jgi:hypothetical protein